MMPLRIWEFLIGFVIAYYLTNEGNIKTQNYQWLGLIGLIVLCAIPFIRVDGQSLNRLEAHPSFYALLVCFATSLVLSCGLPKVLQESSFGNFLAKIGDYSYSIYLVHFPIIVLYLYEPFSGTILYPENYVDKAILLGLIIVTSVLMHRYVETRRINSASKVYATSLVSILLLVGGTKIAPSIMYNQNDQNIFAGLNDRAVYRCGKIVRITNPTAISCKINEESFDRSVLLVGNSHADSIKQAFAEVASTHKMNTYFMVSNTPLMDSSVTPKTMINEAIKLDIRHIVLHYKSKSLKVDILEEVLHLAEEKGIKVDLILPVPEYEDSIPKLLYLNQFKSINKQKYLSENTEYFANKF